MTARAALDSYIETLQILARAGDGDRTDEERGRNATYRAKLIDDHAHELAERLRNVHGSGEGDAWNWWDAADIPAACADLIDPIRPERPVSGEEKTA